MQQTTTKTKTTVAVALITLAATGAAAAVITSIRANWNSSSSNSSNVATTVVSSAPTTAAAIQNQTASTNLQPIPISNADSLAAIKKQNIADSQKAPHITSISPTEGPKGTIVTIKGSGFLKCSEPWPSISPWPREECKINVSARFVNPNDPNAAVVGTMISHPAYLGYDDANGEIYVTVPLSRGTPDSSIPGGPLPGKYQLIVSKGMTSSSNPIDFTVTSK